MGNVRKKATARRQAAVALATRDLSVFPLHTVENGRCSCGKADCGSPGKHPHTAHGVNDATADPRQVRRYWEKSPDANIGLATGQASGVLVVDIDPRNGGDATWKALIEKHGKIPKTVQCRTGGGGRHIYFAHPGGDIRCGNGKLGPGVDIKANGGYVVAPPSEHASGQQYEWKPGHGPDEVDLAPPPKWLTKMLMPGQQRAPDGGPADDGVFREGERNAALASLAGSMRRRGMSQKAIEAALLVENAKRCVPPLVESEVRQIATNISSYKAEPRPRSKLVSRRLSIIKSEDVQWLWSGRIPLGKVTMISGDPGLGKSFITLDIAARVSQGESWPDSGKASRGSVLLLSAEDDPADTIRPRLDRLGAAANRIHVIDGVRLGPTADEAPFSLARDLAALERKLKKHKDVKLVVIDPITAYLGERTDSHKNADVRALLAPLAKLAARYKVAIVCVTHLNKASGGKAVYRSSGSLAFVAAARTGWLVIKDPDDPERRLLLMMKNNLAPAQKGLAYRISDGQVVWDEKPVTLSADEAIAAEEAAGDRREREDAQIWLKQVLKDGPRRAKEVVQEGRENGFSTSTLRRAKTELGIVATRVGKLGEAGYWEWSMPS